MNWNKIAFFGALSGLGIMGALALDAHIYKENSVIGIAMTVNPEKSASTLPASEVQCYGNECDRPEADENGLELVYLTEQTEYRGGDVAYVDYSVDTIFGECVVVWIESRRNWSHCDDVEAGWQTLYLRSVPAGTSFTEISLDWNDTHAPDNWR